MSAHENLSSGQFKGYHVKLERGYDNSSGYQDHSITATHATDGVVGRLTWDAGKGHIKDIRVNEEHQRRGVATQMYQHAKKHTYIEHSNDRTVEGTKWAESTGDRVPPLIEIKK